MGILYIVATPIGNLGDITMRALEILKEADFILCEDTRVTKKLLGHYSISKPLISYHQHSRLQKMEHVIWLLKSGKNLALVSDAGTPGISDPGNALVEKARKEGIVCVPLPGPSAITAIASVSGLSMDRFLFLGFPPHKKRRAKFFERVLLSDIPVILYESPHRITKTLKELADKDKAPQIVVGRELTKKFETIYLGTAEEMLAQIEKEGPRWEYTLVVSRQK